MKYLLNYSFNEFIDFCEICNIDKWIIEDYTNIYQQKSIEELDKNETIKYLYSLRKRNNLKFSGKYEPISWVNSYNIFYFIIKGLLINNNDLSKAKIITEYTIPNHNERIDVIITYQNFLFIYELSFLKKYENEKTKIQSKLIQLKNYDELLKKELNLKNIIINKAVILLNEDYLNNRLYLKDINFILNNISLKQSISFKQSAYEILFNKKNPNCYLNEINFKETDENEKQLSNEEKSNHIAFELEYSGICTYEGFLEFKSNRMDPKHIRKRNINKVERNELKDKYFLLTKKEFKQE